MENTNCNSFYENKTTATSLAVNEPITVLANNSTSKKTVEKTDEKAIEEITAPKKKSTLWIWAASYFAAVLISPRENINYTDKNNTTITP